MKTMFLSILPLLFSACVVYNSSTKLATVKAGANVIVTEIFLKKSNLAWQIELRPADPDFNTRRVLGSSKINVHIKNLSETSVTFFETPHRVLTPQEEASIVRNIDTDPPDFIWLFSCEARSDIRLRLKIESKAPPDGEFFIFGRKKDSM